MYALIMGSSGDIGTSTAKNLAKKGWSLYLHYNRNAAPGSLASKANMVQMYNEKNEKNKK